MTEEHIKLIMFTLLFVIAIAVILTDRRAKNDIVGVLEIDTRDEEKDKYMLFVEVPIEDLPKKQYVSFRVVNKGDK